MTAEVRTEVVPPWPFRLPRGGGRDGVLRRRGNVLERLVHVEGEPAVVRVAQTAADRVLFGAWSRTCAVGRAAIDRMRFALGVDDDLRPFWERFRDDPWIGAAVRAQPWMRIRRRPEPFEALSWAVCEQLIEYGRAAAIERRIVTRFGRRCRETGLRDLPAPIALAGVAPAQLQAFDLSQGRALALLKVARMVAGGRVDLADADHEATWRRLRAVRGIGPWTVEMLALHGQGRYDAIPAGDVGFINLCGRVLSGGDPHAKASEVEVRSMFARFGEWKGLAGAYARRSGVPL